MIVVVAMDNNEYWGKRFLQLEESSHQDATILLELINNQYYKVQKELELNLRAWYQRFADNNGVSLSAAKQILNSSQLREFKWDINEYIKTAKANTVSGQWVKELENASAQYHISRFEAIQIQMQQSLELMFGNQLDHIDSFMRQSYTQNYYQTIFEIQRGFNIGWNVSAIDTNKLSKIIIKPWAVDGLNFSDRIWNNKSKLVNELHTELTRMCITGEAPDRAIKEIAKKFNTSRNNSGRLVMTESAYFSSVSQKDAFAELEVQQYRIVATLDSKTSDICQRLDGMVFDMEDYEPGDTAPPFHVNCRTVTVPHFEDEFSIGERFTRNEDEQTYYVPSNLNYKEWKEKYVDNNGKNAIIKSSDVHNKKYKANLDYINSKEYKSKFSGISDSKRIDNAIHKYSKFAVESNDGLATENIIILNSKTGKLISNTKTGDFGGKLVIPKADADSLMLVHNHPNNTSFSIEDIITLNSAPEIKTIIAAAHDGKVYKLSISDGMRVSADAEIKLLINKWGYYLKQTNKDVDKSVKILALMNNWKYEVM